MTENSKKTDESPLSPAENPTSVEADELGLDALQQFEFVINEDGSVTFVDFPPELLDLAYALNPDDPLVCERMALSEGAGDEEA